MKRLRVLTAGVVVVVAGIVIHDALREPCSRASTHAWSWLLWATRADPWAAPRGVGTQRLEGFVVDDPWAMRGAMSRDAWKEVQGAEVTIVPDLDLALISPPHWKGDPDDYLAHFTSDNPAAKVLTLSSSLPRFLLVQRGGGVEGLSKQVLLTADGSLRVWNPGIFSEAEKFGAPNRRLLDRDVTDRLLQLSDDAAFPAGEIWFEYTCGALDGGVIALTYFDGVVLGRVQYQNGRRPQGTFAQVVAELEHMAERAMASEVETPDESASSPRESKSAMRGG